MDEVPDESVQLIVTSPPYPMIEMWDDQFRRHDPVIGGRSR
jgi:DNA modification methylase